MTRLFEDIWNGGDLGAMDRVFAPEVVVHTDPVTESRGRSVSEEVIAAWLIAFPDLHHTIDDLVETAQATVVRWHGAGTHRGTFMGIAPTGRPMTYGGMTWCRLADGLIAEAWVAANVDQMVATLTAPS